MSDLKSKLPDLNEISSMAGKLFKGIKKSVVDVIDDYKKNHPAETAEETKAKEKVQAEATKAAEKVKAEATKAAEKVDVEKKEKE